MNNSKTVLIVDDDPSVLASIAMLCKQHGFRSISAAGPAQALSMLAEHPVDVVIQDMNFSRNTSGEEGMALLQDIKAQYPGLPVILMTAWGSIELAVEGIKCGAADFMTKPWQNTQLIKTIETTLKLHVKTDAPLLTRQQLDEQYDFSAIVGEDPAMLEVLSTIGRVAATDAPVLILGESGTGKELIADAIHKNSKRSSNTFNKVNLGGMNATLFESEMFGHVRGAFTDAKQDRIGQFESANGGSLFLDEMGDLDPSSQVKLLRVLQDQSFQPVGSSKTRTADVRVISATNRNLYEMVSTGDFREDLLYRINLITINLPALRNRRGDIRALALQHLTRVIEQYQLQPMTLHESAMLWLERQPWPGNVRQLTQTIERAALMAASTELQVIDFEPASGQADTKTNDSVELDFGNMTLEQVEKLRIEQALLSHQGNLTKVAEALDISRAALYRRLEKYGLSA